MTDFDPMACATGSMTTEGYMDAYAIGTDGLIIEEILLAIPIDIIPREERGGGIPL